MQDYFIFIPLYQKFDESKPDGQYKKTVSNKKMKKIWPNFKFTRFDEGRILFLPNLHEIIRAL